MVTLSYDGVLVLSERIRSFISVDIEDPLILDRIERIKETIIATNADLKPVEKENIHLTLRFLGEIPVALIDEVYRVMLSVKMEPFEIEIKGVGAFPRITSPRVVWVGVTKGSDKLKEIHRQLEAGLRKLGIKPDSKGFEPHITIARVRSARNKQRLVKVLYELEDVEIGKIVVTNIRLKQSILTFKGPIYKTLREVKLG